MRLHASYHPSLTLGPSRVSKLLAVACLYKYTDSRHTSAVTHAMDMPNKRGAAANP
jgi:hypothetical protein